MSYFEDQKAIAHIEKAIREGRNPGAIWSEGQGDINGFINRHSHESFQDEIAKAKIRLNPNNTQDGDVQAYQRRLWKREDEYKKEADKAKRNQSQGSQPFPTTYNTPSVTSSMNAELKAVANRLSSLSNDDLQKIVSASYDVPSVDREAIRKLRDELDRREAPARENAEDFARQRAYNNTPEGRAKMLEITRISTEKRIAFLNSTKGANQKANQAKILAQYEIEKKEKAASDAKSNKLQIAKSEKENLNNSIIVSPTQN